MAQRETHVCETCGKKFVKNLSKDSYHGGNCFDCSFWLQKVELPDDLKERQIIINSEHYMIGDDDSLFRGFGGRRYDIAFFNGKQIKTNNLWYQGEIPSRFQGLLPNNAVFVDADNERHGNRQLVKSGELPF